MSRRVFILGAGASAAMVGLPIDSGFFFAIEKYKDLELHMYHRGINSSVQPIPYLREIRTLFYPQMEFETFLKQGSLEEIYTFVELEEEWNNKYSNSRLSFTSSQFLSEVYRLLVRFHPERAKNTYDWFSCILNAQPDTTIISFNWDTYLDEYLSGTTNKTVSVNDEEKNFQLKFVSSYEEYNNSVMATNQNKKIRHNYFKLHGSLDWFRCTNKDCENYPKVARDPYYPGRDFMPLSCNGCKSPIKLVIVPPALHKNYDEVTLLSDIWHRAYESLSDCEEIIVIGYSLPPTDFRTRWLFRSANAASKVTNVKLYLKAEEKSEQELYRKRYADIYGNDIDLHIDGYDAETEYKSMLKARRAQSNK